MKQQSDEEIRQQLNLETGKITWPELQRHFARGVVIKVARQLDLVEIAVKFVQDDKRALEQWVDTELVCRASDADAINWNDNNTLFWAVVAAPWVLVQEITEQ
ncbi:DUF2288 domain-containing protein [Kaarinaea lacus]